MGAIIESLVFIAGEGRYLYAETGLITVSYLLHLRWPGLANRHRHRIPELIEQQMIGTEPLPWQNCAAERISNGRNETGERAKIGHGQGLRFAAGRFD